MMSAIGLSIFVAIAATAIYLMRLKQRQKRELCGVILTLNQLDEMKSLLLLIQRHRGLTSGCLQGDDKLKPNIDSTRSECDAHWQALHAARPELREDGLFEGIYSHWQRLRERWPEHEVGNNIDQHNRLILNLLYLIENLAEDSPQLALYARKHGFDMVWKEVLEAIEAIGQTRAIGTGIVASGKSSAVDRIRLKFLMEKVSNHLQQLLQNFSKAPGDHSQEVERIQFAQARTEILMAFTNQYLLADQITDVSAERFFEVASEAINPLDQLFSTVLQRLKQNLAPNQPS